MSDSLDPIRPHLIDVTVLLAAITYATRTQEVITPGYEDFYSSEPSYSKDTLTYVDGEKLTEYLQELQKHKEPK